jgi:5-methylcytosine-specific restriction endonuclease McrA
MGRPKAAERLARGTHTWERLPGVRTLLAKHRFTHAETFGVWQAFDGGCFWCHRPLALFDATVDHIIPESIEPEKHGEVVERYMLDTTFQVNSFSNWVPAHPKCNQLKGDEIYTASPAMIQILARVAKHAEAARNVAEKVASDKKKDRILGRLLVAFEAGTVSQDDLHSFLEGLLAKPKRGVPAHSFRIAPDWEVIRASDGIALVGRGHQVGITPTSDDAHWSWVCPTCGNRGPWNGVICMSCGRKSDPND